MTSKEAVELAERYYDFDTMYTKVRQTVDLIIHNYSMNGNFSVNIDSSYFRTVAWKKPLKKNENHYGSEIPETIPLSDFLIMSREVYIHLMQKLAEDLKSDGFYTDLNDGNSIYLFIYWGRSPNYHKINQKGV